MPGSRTTATGLPIQAQNRKRRFTGGQSGRKRLGKGMLLPHTATFVREQSLYWHLALAAFRVGKANGDLPAELAKALYLAQYLEEAGFGALEDALYLEAERILDFAAAERGQRHLAPGI